MHAPAAALRQGHQLASGLGLRQRPQARSRAALGQRDVLQLVGRQDEEHAHVRAALLQLAGGVQVARAHLQARHHAEGLGHAVADGLDSLATALSREGQKRVQREEVAGLDGG